MILLFNWDDGSFRDMSTSTMQLAIFISVREVDGSWTVTKDRVNGKLGKISRSELVHKVNMAILYDEYLREIKS